MNASVPVSKRLFVAAAMTLLAACANQMEPAQKAIEDIKSAMTAAPADADKYIPDQVASVEQKLVDLNTSFGKKDYAAVLADAPAVLAQAKGLAAAAAAKKDEAMKALAAQWSQLSASVPQLIASLNTRVNALSKTRRKPKGIDLAAAKSGLADATVLWAKAQTAFQAKQVADAVTAAKDAMSKAEATASALKMSSS
jgi:hypothetical protein